MKKIIANLLALSFCCAFNAQAISIDLIPQHNNIQLGNTVDVEARISGLDAGSAASLSSYELNLHYDASLFSFSSIQWGDNLVGNQLDLLGFGSLQDANSATSGLLQLFEVSIDSADDLNLLQAGSFTLFKLVFNTVAVGAADFSIRDLVLGDAYGLNLNADSITGNRVTVSTSTELPEPASWLLLLGLLAVVVLRYKVHQHSK